ncbi:MAG TPA: response regulator [Candidatus Saccharimonadales bacterium]
MSHILLIEPNTVLAKTYTQALHHAGHTAAHAVGAQAAIGAADKQTPDVVIMELQLPQHGGIEFLHEFRSYAEWLDVPVVVNTALPPARMLLAKQSLVRDFGVREILYKPRTTLQDIIRIAREHALAQ